MITKSKQNWQINEIVKIGFLKLRITGMEKTPGDFMPDAYFLCGLGENEHKKYRFVPHNGIERIN